MAVTYVRDGETGQLMFRPLPTPTHAESADVARRTADRPEHRRAGPACRPGALGQRVRQAGRDRPAPEWPKLRGMSRPRRRASSGARQAAVFAGPAGAVLRKGPER